MKFVDNPELKKEVAKLQAFVKQIHDDMACLNEAISDHETDDMDAMKTYDDNVFNIRQRLFDAKINLDKLHKKVHKHISETLAPDYYALKKLARKKKSVNKINNLGTLQGFEGLHKGGNEPAPKHITINRKKDGNT